MGPCEAFAPIHVAELVEWIGAIDFEDWPQQHRLQDGRIRPAMVTDQDWFGFGGKTEPFVRELLARLGGGWAYQRMLSVVMPGHDIHPHRDAQDLDWVRRVHVPLVTNPRAVFIADGTLHHMEVGQAYLVNTRVTHEVWNDGKTPRVHFMFDVRSTSFALQEKFK